MFSFSVTVTDGTFTVFSDNVVVTIIAAAPAAPASTDASLSALSLSTGDFNESFVTTTLAYTADVAATVTRATVTATATDDVNAMVAIGGTAADDATPLTVTNETEVSGLTAGDNTITITVTAEDTTAIQTYTITLTRAASTDASLSALSLSTGDFNEAFATDTLGYTASVASDIISATITATATDGNADVAITGADTDGTALTVSNSGMVAGLTVGANIITVTVTAEDGTTREYTITVTRTSPDDFVTTWRTSGDNESITIPTTGTGYNYTVDWGDGTAMSIGVTTDAIHTYATQGNYEVRISGTFPRIYFNDAGDKDKIIAINQWGNQAWTSMERAFLGASNLTGQATDSPDLSIVTNMLGMFFNAAAFNQDIGNWNVSSVNDMSVMFAGASAFNQDINDWDVGSVTTMSQMFDGATAFNRNIGGWDVGSVTIMSQMFNGATAFNQDIGNWNVEKVTNMLGMFFNASAFDQDISGWNVSNVTDMSSMFDSASAFNRNIGGWDVSSVTTMSHMFNGATAFNQNIGGWDVGSVTTMSNMFNGVTLSTDNYDALLLGWSTIETGESALQNGVIFHGGNSMYCAGTAARDILTGAPNNWTITSTSDGGQAPGCSSDATLSDLSLSPGTGTLTVTFDSATTDYTAVVAADATSTTVTPIAEADTVATITVNGVAVSSGVSTMIPVDPASGEIDVTIVVTAQDGTLGNYTITTEEDTTPSFETMIPVQIYALNGDLNTILPAAVGGNGTVMYTIVTAASPTAPGPPDWLNLDSVTRVVTGTPTGELATTAFLYVATDGNGDQDSTELSLVVEMGDRMPDFGGVTAPAPYFAAVGRPFTFSLPAVATEGNGTAAYTITPPAVTTGYSFDPFTREFTGTPGDVLSATDFSYVAQDADGDTAELGGFQFEVFGQFDVSTAGDRIFTAGKLITFALPAIDSGGTGDTRYTVQGLPSGLSFDTGALEVSGTPDVADVYQVTYSINAAQLSGVPNTDELIIPVAQSFTITIETDTMPSFGTASIPEQIYSADRTIAVLFLPVAEGGNRVVYSITGALTPPPDWLMFDADERTITGVPEEMPDPIGLIYTATDSEMQTASIIFTIAVEANVTPDFGSNTVPNLTFFVGLDSPVTLTEAASQGNGATSYSLTPALPAALTYDADMRVIRGFPDSPQSATLFTYTATDRDGDAVDLTFSVTVYPQIVIPPIGVRNISVGRQITIALPTALGGSGGYSYAVSALPDGLSFDSSPSTPQILGTATTTEVTTLTYTVRDTIPPEEASLIFTIAVETDTVPSFDVTIADQTYVLGVPVPVGTILSEAVSGNGDIVYAIEAASGGDAPPGGLSFDPLNRTISGTPAAAMSETRYVYRATDRDGDDDTTEFSITVIPPMLAAPTLNDSSNSGDNDDSITNQTDLTFNGSDALSDAVITVTATSSSGLSFESAVLILWIHPETTRWSWAYRRVYGTLSRSKRWRGYPLHLQRRILWK